MERHVCESLPFVATERWLMLGVAAGGDRQALHEVIRRHSLAVAERVSRGETNDLLTRLAGEALVSRSSRSETAVGAQSSQLHRSRRAPGHRIHRGVPSALAKSGPVSRRRARGCRGGGMKPGAATLVQSRLPLPLASEREGPRSVRGRRGAPLDRGQRSGQRLRRGHAGTRAS